MLSPAKTRGLTRDFLLPFDWSEPKKQKKKKQCFHNYSDVWTSCHIFVFLFFSKFCIPGLIQINPHQFWFIPSLTHHLSNKQSSLGHSCHRTCELPTIWAASIVSRVGYTMAIWACVCHLSKPKETKKKTTKPSSCQIFVVFFLLGLD